MYVKCSDTKKKKPNVVDSKSKDSPNDIIPKLDKPKSKHDKKKKPKASTPPESLPATTPCSVEKITKMKPLLSPLPVVKSPLPVDRKESVASSVEEPSGKSSIDEEPNIVNPLSPCKKKSLPPLQVESDWSSEEDFTSSLNPENLILKHNRHSKHLFDKAKGGSTKFNMALSAKVVSLRKPAPEFDHVVESKSTIRVKQAKHLPRTYQFEESTMRKETNHSRGAHLSKRYFSGPSSPSPPPPTYGSYRRRPRYSSQEQHERSRHRRSRPYSPVPRLHRKHSRSPQRFRSPGLKGKSPSPR